jgi:hypothetical protein
MKRALLSFALATSALASQATPAYPVFVEPEIQHIQPENPAWRIADPQCPWENTLFETLPNATKYRVRGSHEKADGAATLKLSARIEGVVPNNEESGRIELLGELKNPQGKVVGDFVLRYDLSEGLPSRCKSARGIGKEFAEQIADWLEEPGPSIKISETEDSLHPETMPPGLWQSCPIETQLPYQLTQIGTPGRIYRADRILAQEPGRVLTVKVVDVLLPGGGMFTQHWIKLAGSLRDNGKEIGSFVAKRSTMRSWRLCSIIERLHGELAEDITRWLEHPTMNAFLGNADETEDALR